MKNPFEYEIQDCYVNGSVKRRIQQQTTWHKTLSKEKKPEEEIYFECSEMVWNQKPKDIMILASHHTNRRKVFE